MRSEASRRAVRAWKKRNPDKVKAEKRAWHKRFYPKNSVKLRKKSCDHYHKNKSSSGYNRSVRDKHLRVTYGLTLAGVEGMLKKQSGKCAICKSRIVLRSGRGNVLSACVDHCHNTGKIRGLLCRRCNFGLGSFKESPKNFSSAIRYIKSHSKS